MSRYRLCPTDVQEAALLRHCAHARFVWNLAVEQHGHWRPGRKGAPRWAEQCRQLTEARTEFAWLRTGSQTVQQQALLDFSHAVHGYMSGAGRRPTWRKAGRCEGFRIVGSRGNQWDVRRLSRRVAQVRIPKVGWVKFRLSRPVADGAKSFRVNRDSLGRWHVAFASPPPPIPGPGSGMVVGVDRGVVVSAVLSTGEMLHVPTLRPAEIRRLRRLQRSLARAVSGSRRRSRTRSAIAVLRARGRRRRQDWCEKSSTYIARRFDVIGVEDLNIRNMTRSASGSHQWPGRNVAQKAGLNRAVLAAGWGRLARRLEDKAVGRVIKVKAAFTSQRCSTCDVVDRKARESQAVFRCRHCGYVGNADVNAAINIATAAGRAVAARGGFECLEPLNREPQLASS